MSSSHPNWLTEEYLKKLLKNHLKNEADIQKYEVTLGSSPGDGYASQIYRIKILDANNKSVSIIAKELAQHEWLKKSNEIFGFYFKEKLELQILFPKMLAKLPNPTRFFPEFYHADDAILTLFEEDLCQYNYSLCPDHSSGLDLDHSLLVMEALAKLHASSYLVFKEEPELIKKFELSFYSEANLEFVEKMVENARKCLLAVLHLIEIPEEYKTKIKNSENWTSKLLDAWKRKENSINVLLHVDCWVNNLMFKYVEGGVQTVKLIDFQLGTYNSFALDLVMFINSSTSTHVRTNSMDTLLNHYYTVFTSIAKIPNFTIETIHQEIQSRLFMAFIATVSGAAIVMAPPKQQAFDVDAIMKNEDSSDNLKPFKNPKYLDLLSKTLPFLMKENVI